MLKGLVPVVLTPMLQNGDLDEGGFENLTSHLLNANVGGLWALGSAAEEINLGLAQKLKVAKLFDKLVGNKSPVIIGTGMTSIYDHYKFLDEISECDFAGVHILPYDTKMGRGRTVNLFSSLAERSSHPIWLYHNPKRARPFEIDLVSELASHENIAGIKVGGYDLTFLTRCFMLKNSDFDVIGAGSGQLYQCLALGAEAHTTSEGSLFPNLFSKIFTLFNAGERSKAWELQKRWITLNSLMPRTDNGEHAAEEKFMLSLMGVCQEWVNPNYRILTNDEKIRVKTLFDQIGRLE